MIEKPKKVMRCTTHHYACDCREWNYERMERMLKVIRTWAAMASDYPSEALGDIISNIDELFESMQEEK